MERSTQKTVRATKDDYFIIILVVFLLLVSSGVVYFGSEPAKVSAGGAKVQSTNYNTIASVSIGGSTTTSTNYQLNTNSP